MTEEQLYTELEQRKGVIQGVVISGGEPTLQPDLPEFLTRLRTLGLPIKLDTNGYKPKMIKKLLDQKLVDYMAMDIKSNAGKYEDICGCKINMAHIKESIKLIIASDVDYEFRTTVLPELTDKDFWSILNSDFPELKGAKKYVLQQFHPRNTKDKYYHKLKPVTSNYLNELKARFAEHIDVVEIKNL